MTTVAYADLPACDLIPGWIYAAKPEGTYFEAEPISQLLPVGVARGIRHKGKATDPALVALKITPGHPAWPDHYDLTARALTYFGDNKTPGKDLHSTLGNKVLKHIFLGLRGEAGGRQTCPPVFVFEEIPGLAPSVRFIGTAVPGSVWGSPQDDLVAKWLTVEGGVVLNYEARFTFLPEFIVRREWINELSAGLRLGRATPREFADWTQSGN
jgi:hypothetical protein